jgi:hypothetical protein
MRQFLLFTLIACGLLGCVPKSQYDALVVERDYYRKQTINQDSLAELRIRAVTDSITIGEFDEESRIRQVEELTATNRILQQDLLKLRERYDALVEMDKTTPAQTTSDAAMMIDRLESELSQSLQRALPSGYTLTVDDPEELHLALNYDLLLTPDLEGVSEDGRNLLRRLYSTLVNYPKLNYIVVARGEGGMGAPAASYRQSIDRSIAVASQLVDLGLSPTRMIVGTKGRYGSASSGDVMDRPGKPVVEMRITYGD